MTLFPCCHRTLVSKASPISTCVTTSTDVSHIQWHGVQHALAPNQRQTGFCFCCLVCAPVVLVCCLHLASSATCDTCVTCGIGLCHRRSQKATSHATCGNSLVS